MKATCAPGTRRIKVTGCPSTIGRLENMPTEIEIKLNLIEYDNPVVAKAIVLDHIIVPAILKALNRPSPSHVSL